MISIRNFREGDAPQLRQLFFNTIRTINRRDYSDDELKAWAPDDINPTRWLEEMQSINPFVAEIDRQIVGYTDLQDDGLIDHFFCHHEHQGRGVGRFMMQHIIVQARVRGIKRLHSHVSITAKPFYLHFGFSVNKTQRVEVRGQMLENNVMEKLLETEK